MAEPLTVVVAGLPGSGKTTLARDLAPRLDCALLSKDVIKEVLFDALGTGSLEWSRTLGRASHLVMYALAREAPRVVLEAHFERGRAEPDLASLERPLVQVYCRVPVGVAEERYRRRVDDPARHPGHLPEHQSDTAIAAWTGGEPGPLRLDGPLLTVDTTGPVDVERLVADVKGAVGRS